MTSDPPRVSRFRAIYTAHHDDLWRYCLRRTRTPHDAEDVLADVFTVAWRRLDELPDGDDARPWLFTVAHNHLRNSWRRNDRGRELDARLSVDVSIDTTTDAETDATNERRSAVLDALGRLADSDAEILRLAVWDELSHRDIAAILECTENAVGIRLHRARARLAAELGSQRGPSSSSDTALRHAQRPAPPSAAAPIPAPTSAPTLDTHEGDRHE